MAIPPVDNGYTRRTGVSPTEERARQAERDAGRRVTEAEKQVQDARRSADQRIDEIRDQYEKRSEDENARSLERVEKQKMRGYEQLRDLQRSQQVELGRTRREGERDVKNLKEFYMDSTASIEHQGDESIRGLENRHARELELQTRARQDELELAKTTQQQQMDVIRQENDEKVQNLTQSSRKEYERMRENSSLANTKADQSFNQKHTELVKGQNEVLSDLQSRTAQAVREIRKDSASKLAAYESRQKDPFYKLLDLDANVTEYNNEYVLTATIPQHEQKNVSISVKGGSIVLSGTRRNEEKLELAPGRTQGTNAFQSYLETFPIQWPVDATRLTREFDGDQLTVRVPKKKENLEYHSPVKEKPARLRAEKPKFPENIPIAKKTDSSGRTPEDLDAPPESTSPTKKNRIRDKTLS